MLSYWHLALAHVRTHAALVAVCNDFLASWTPEQLAALPERCRPARIGSAAEIAGWIGVLSEALFDCQDEAAGDALRDMLGFLFIASDRAAELPGDPQADADEADLAPAQ